MAMSKFLSPASTRWPVLFLLAGCAHSTTAAPTHPAAPHASSRELVEWSAVDSTIACPFTGTKLTLPRSWNPMVQRNDESEVIVLPVAASPAALLVRGAFADASTEDVWRDLESLYDELGVPFPDEISVTAIEFQNWLLRVDYEANAPDKGAFRFGYRLVQRNGVACRMATLERRSHGDERVLSTLLERVTDSPGLDVNAVVPTQPDNTAAVLQGTFALGVNLLRGFVSR
jgi:hypothetical protein